MLTKLVRFAVDTKSARFAVDTKLVKFAVDTKLVRFAVLTRPVTFTEPDALLIYPAVPRPMTVATRLSLVMPPPPPPPVFVIVTWPTPVFIEIPDPAIICVTATFESPERVDTRLFCR